MFKSFKKVAVIPTIIIYLFTVLFSAVPFSYAEDSGEQVFYYLHDHLGGIETVLDEDGDVVERRDYFPFGSERQQIDPQYDPRLDPQSESYGYTGKELDGETGLYYYGARYYDPDIGRFTQIDPLVLNEAQKTDKSIEDILPAPQMLNGYSYVNNNPLKYIDPTGEFLFTATIDPTAEIPDIAFGQQYKPDEFSLLEKQVIITAGSLATFAPAIYNAGNIISDIGRVFIISKNIKNKIPQQKNSTIKISPDELTPTEKFDPDHLHVVQRKIENKGEFYTSKPVRYYENDGKKLIVDGHHRTQAAKNLKMDVYAKPVDAAYFKERFNANVDDFLGKAKDFINKSVKK